MRLDAASSTTDRGARGPADDVAAWRRALTARRRRAGVADDGHDGGVRRGARRRRVGPAVVSWLPWQDAGAAERLVAGDRASVEQQRAAGIEAEGVGEVAEAVVGRAGRDDDAAPGRAVDLERGDGRERPCPPGCRDAGRNGNVDRRSTGRDLVL